MPPGPELERSNRLIRATRSGWPDGTVFECQRLARIYPEWHVSWMGACAWAGRPAGFHAWRRSQRIHVCGATPEELEQAIEAAPPPWDYRLSNLLD